MTIGEYFGGANLERCDRQAFDFISDGQITFTTLGEPKEEILAYCRIAVSHLGGLPFLGRVSLAKVMNYASGLLLKEKGINAPRSWYPTITALKQQHNRDVTKFKRLLHAPAWLPSVPVGRICVTSSTPASPVAQPVPEQARFKSVVARLYEAAKTAAQSNGGPKGFAESIVTAGCE